MSNWIKCSDRLPELDIHVLVAVEFFGPGDWRQSIGAIDSRNGAQWWLKGSSFIPTHWMPLPSPPESEQ